MGLDSASLKILSNPGFEIIQNFADLNIFDKISDNKFSASYISLIAKLPQTFP